MRISTAMLISAFLMLVGKVVGETAAPFEYTISVPTTNLLLGQPLQVTCTLSNVTDNDQTVKSWRGPLAGVTVGADEYDFAIFVLASNNAVRLKYQSKFACGPASYMTLPPHAKWERAYVMNDLLYPAYKLDSPGTYELRSTYFSYADRTNRQTFYGSIKSQPIRIHVSRLNATGIKAQRELLSSSNYCALAVLAAHRDDGAVVPISSLCGATNTETRSRAHKALSEVGSDSALRALGNALSKEPEYIERIEIIRLLGQSGNPIAIPYLQMMLGDTYVNRIGINGKWYHQYTVRKWASSALTKLGVTDNTQYMEEITNDPNQAVEAIGGPKPPQPHR